MKILIIIMTLFLASCNLNEQSDAEDLMSKANKYYETENLQVNAL